MATGAVSDEDLATSLMLDVTRKNRRNTAHLLWGVISLNVSALEVSVRVAGAYAALSGEESE